MDSKTYYFPGFPPIVISGQKFSVLGFVSKKVMSAISQWVEDEQIRYKSGDFTHTFEPIENYG